MGRAEPAYISNPYSIYTGSRIRVFGLCVYTRPSTCPSRRTTLNLPWIRARTERGRTGQFSIQVGQSRSSVSCTRLTLIFPISSSSFSSVFQPLRSSGEVKSFIYRIENPKSIHRCRMAGWPSATGCRVKLFSLVPFFPPNFRKMESTGFA